MKRLAECSKNQEGFTLVELLIALAVSAIVGTLAISALLQYANVSAAEQDTMLATSQIKRFSSVLSQDLICANSGEVLDGGQTLVLYRSTFEFGELLEPVAYSVSYTLVDNEIFRATDTGTVSVAKGVQSIDYGPVGPLSEICKVQVEIEIGDVVEVTAFSLHRRPS